LVFGTPKTLVVPSYKYAWVPKEKTYTEDAQHTSTCLLRRRIRYFIPFVGVHRRSGERVSGISSLILRRERANKVFGKCSARPLERFHIAVLCVLIATARLLPHQWGVTRRRQARGGADRRCRLLYPVIPVRQEMYGFLSLTISFMPSTI
jgi:hypothetical protein